MTDDDKDLQFAPESLSPPEDFAARATWTVLVVDDDPLVHESTQLALANFEFDGRKLQLLHAHSAPEAQALLAAHPDIAVALLDVAMEGAHTGLELVRHIRETRANSAMRLVLRTGNSNAAPAEEMVRDHAISTYQDKTELTPRKLRAILYATLRTFCELYRAQRSQQALALSVEALEALQALHQAEQPDALAATALQGLSRWLGRAVPGLQVVQLYVVATRAGHLQVLAATPGHAGLLDTDQLATLPSTVQQALDAAERAGHRLQGPRHHVGHVRDAQGRVTLVYIGFRDDLAHDLDPALQAALARFCDGLAHSTLRLLAHQETAGSLQATLFVLTEALERRGLEGGAHVRRVAELAALLGDAWGLDAEAVAQLRLAAPLHDVGKIGTPEHILSKPGKLDATEWAQMQDHARLGHTLLAASDQPVLQLGARIALQHHEHWDGQGYPMGLVGDEISLEARIVSLADVLDSLVSDRVYQRRWDFDTALDYIASQSGLQFDPRLVKLLLSRLPAVQALYACWPDGGGVLLPAAS